VVTTYTYSNGTTWPSTQTATLAGTDGRYTKTTYDGLGRVKKVEQGNTSGVKTVVEREYTTCACAAAGKLWRVTQPYAPGGTTYWTTYSYDAMGRTVSVAHAGGSGTTTYAYSGNTVTVTDPAGDWKKYWMDVYGNLVRVNEPKPGGGTVDTYYTYTLRDQLAEVSMTRDGTEQVRTWNYRLYGWGRWRRLGHGTCHRCGNKCERTRSAEEAAREFQGIELLEGPQ
jgi:YD repeat-containing protein